MNDLKFVMIFESGFPIFGLRDNFAVTFNRHLTFTKAQMFDQRRRRQTLWKVVMIFAINDEMHSYSKY